MDIYKLGSIGGVIAAINHLVLLFLIISIFNIFASASTLTPQSLFNEFSIIVILGIFFLITIVGYTLFYLGMMKFGEEFDESNTIKTAAIIGLIGSALLPILVGFALESLALLLIGVYVFKIMKKEEKIKDRIGSNYVNLGKITGVLGVIAALIIVIGISASILFYLFMALILYQLKEN